MVAVLALGLLGTAAGGQVIKAEKPPMVPSVPPELLSEQELIQQAISLHLAQSEQDQTERMSRNMDIAVGDIRRVAGLPADRMRMLRVAAKGAVDHQLDNWRPNEENQVRQQAMGNTVSQVRQRLDGLGSINFGFTNGKSEPEDSPLWRDTVAHLLTPEESAKWNAAASGRETYRQQSIQHMLVAEMDRQLDLTLTQCEKLEPLTAKVIQEYLPDMNGFLERGNGIDFRLLLTTFAGVPDNERQGLLTSEQFAKWTQLTADYHSWWQNIEQAHRQRAGQAAPGGGAPQQNIIIRGNGQVIINGGIRVLPNFNNGFKK